MPSSAENLKSIITYFGISQQELADALGVNASQISRWISGQRRLIASNVHMSRITEYFLSFATKMADIDWLKAQFEAAGLPTDTTSVFDTRQNLTIWLSSDGEALRRSLGNTLSALWPKKNKPKALRSSGDSAVKLSALELSLALQPILSGLDPKSCIDIFLSSDEITTITDEDISGLLLRLTEKNELLIRLVVCVSRDTRAMSRLIATYIGALVSGHVQLSVVHGMTQTITHQMHLIVPGRCTVLVTEAPGASASSVGVIVDDESFVRETKISFDQTVRYAHPILSIYGDDYSRNILEIIYGEFCMPGALDVVKDSINPMYMTSEGYNRFLKTRGHSEEEYAWRSAEYMRFKNGLDETLKDGAVFREIISLSRLNDIAKTGFCRMSGLYFMQGGYVSLTAQGCADILNGYIRYLETVPNFHLLIVDKFNEIHESNCWQLKQNHHLAVNCWSGPEPTMIYSDQLMLIREFQNHFDALWANGISNIGNRTNVISILQEVVRRLKINRSTDI